jgi:autophagy-related protein 101
VAVNQKKDHIPPVVSGAATTFPFDVALSTGEASSSVAFGLDAVRRMLSSTNPPSVLH